MTRTTTLFTDLTLLQTDESPLRVVWDFERKEERGDNSESGVVEW